MSKLLMLLTYALSLLSSYLHLGCYSSVLVKINISMHPYLLPFPYGTTMRIELYGSGYTSLSEVTGGYTAYSRIYCLVQG